MVYRLTRKAADDIAHIYLEGVAVFGASQAETYHAEMENTFTLLASNPALARLRDEITPPARVHPYGSHIIIYVIENNQDILIVRVRHGHEDWQSPPES